MKNASCPDLYGRRSSGVATLTLTANGPLVALPTFSDEHNGWLLASKVLKFSGLFCLA